MYANMYIYIYIDTHTHSHLHGALEFLEKAKAHVRIPAFEP